MRPPCRGGAERWCDRSSYGTPSSFFALSTKLPAKTKKLYTALGSALRDQVAPLILQVYMQQLDGVRLGRYCTPRVLHAYFFFVNEM